ncbi:MAG: WhiB family transcriptional regulator [Acidimicrobiales bacterium]
MALTNTTDWDRREWRVEAACRDLDPDLFFPVGSTGAALDEIASATALCRSCPVREQCLDFAMKTNQESGIWGGTSEDERRGLRRVWLASRRRALIFQ